MPNPVIKIELDPRIASVYNHMLVPLLFLGRIPQPALILEPDPPQAVVPVPVPAPVEINNRLLPDPFSFESNRETDKVESFADDKTVTFLATREGLHFTGTM